MGKLAPTHYGFNRICLNQHQPWLYSFGFRICKDDCHRASQGSLGKLGRDEYQSTNSMIFSVNDYISFVKYLFKYWSIFNEKYKNIAFYCLFLHNHEGRN